MYTTFEEPLIACMYRLTVPPTSNRSHICLIVSTNRQIFSFESLLVYFVVLKVLVLATLPCTIRDLASPLKVLVVPTGLRRTCIDLVVSTSLFAQEIIVCFLEVLVAVLTSLRD